MSTPPRPYYDPERPQVCLDETGRQLLAAMRRRPNRWWWPAQGGPRGGLRVRHRERGRVRPVLRSHRAVGRLGRHVVLGERRTRIDFAHCIKESIAMSTTPKHRRSFW
jgi:hypothetical protein